MKQTTNRTTNGNQSDKSRVKLELRRRRKKLLLSKKQMLQARKSLLEFTLYTKKKYNPQWFHERIAKKLDDFVEGRIKRLMIFVPPQHGKSELSSRRLPAYLLGRYPDKKIALCTYAKSLASGFNGDVQKIIDSEEYHRLFPKTLLNESNVVTVAGKAKRNSEIIEVVDREGSLVTVGVGGALTGKTVDVGIIDDVYKDFEAASSKKIRERVVNWYDDVFCTRLDDNAQQLILFTRWHEDDLASYILSKAKPGDWDVIEIPAIAEEQDEANPDDPRKVGEALWPAKHGIEKLEAIRAKRPLRFQCLYQQRPASIAGNKIKTAWFGRITREELIGKLAGRQFKNDVFLDGAYTDKTKNDPSALMSCVYFENTLYIIDSTTKRLQFPDLVTFASDYVKNPIYKLRADVKALAIYIEPKASGTSLAQTMVRNGFNAIEEPAPTTDKEARVDTTSDVMAAGRVVLVEGPWIEQFLIETAAFPLGKHDDQVDNLTAAIRHYDSNIVKKATSGGLV